MRLILIFFIMILFRIPIFAQVIDSTGAIDEETGTAYLKSYSAIQNIPVRGFTNIAPAFTGVAKLDNDQSFHIRGGFSDEHVLYIDDIPIYDPYDRTVSI